MGHNFDCHLSQAYDCVNSGGTQADMGTPIYYNLYHNILQYATRYDIPSYIIIFHDILQGSRPRLPDDD